MKQLGAFITILVLALTFSGSSAAAETVSASSQLHIYAQVTARQAITVNLAGEIVQIASNTTEDIAPRVYVGSVLPENEIPLTNAVYVAYRQYVPAGSAHPGILYENQNDTVLSSMIRVYLATVPKETKLASIQ